MIHPGTYLVYIQYSLSLYLVTRLLSSPYANHLLLSSDIDVFACAGLRSDTNMIIKLEAGTHPSLL